MSIRKDLGFTLIELSIVLVIIGLIVGGVLVGRDLIEAARIRAQISQIASFNAAVNTFRAKFNFLPGDIPEPHATQLGFTPRGTACGQGDGDGLLWGGGWGQCLPYRQTGETLLFWRDLSDAKLIPGAFSTAPAIEPTSDTVGAEAVGGYLPAARIGNNNFVYVFNQQGNYSGNKQNNFGIAIVTEMWGSMASITGMSVNAAYTIDSKIDDGLPYSGTVTTTIITNDNYLADGTPLGAGQYITANGKESYNKPGTGNSCFDNRNDRNQVMQYSTNQNNGAGINCALSFQFQ